jgi:nicotinate-nucleotide adenylyltransferase
MNARARIGFLGGTFDPIHLGHLEAAGAARAALGLERVVVVPARLPQHRHQQPAASSYHRFAMAALAISGLDGLVVSDVELASDGPSYTADTLTRLHVAGYSTSQIFFITGADAFAEIETWHRYPDVLDLAHFVVVARPGHSLGDLPGRLPALAGRMTRAAAPPSPARTAVFLVEAETPDVSSTEIRGRIGRHERLTGLVAPAVEAYIVQHGLYGASRAPA